MLLDVVNLKTYFRGADGRVARAVDGISFSIGEGETLALVGESGCGKSVTAHSLLRLLPSTAFHPSGGIRFDGESVLGMPEAQVERLRGNRIAMVFQEPMTSLNPVMRVGKQLMEPLELHRGMDPASAAAEALRLMKRVGIPEPEQRLREYPHQLSGGMKQRVMIAMALACRPRLLVADEPTTALDVTIQAQILSLMKDLQAETGMAMLFITHDLGIVNQIADRVCIMYAGQIVEQGACGEVFQTMAHPYTRGLFRSLPAGSARTTALPAIPGAVPAADAEPVSGCRFRERCPVVLPRCAGEESRAHPVPPAAGGSGSGASPAPAHTAACHRWDPAAAEGGLGDGRTAACSSRPPEPPPATVVPVSAEPAAPPPEKTVPLLEVAGLRAWFPVRRGMFSRVHAHVKAVDGVSLRLRRGETLALVGESGCGKTTVGLSLLRLLKEAEGRIVFQGRSVLEWDQRELRRMRRRMQMVFQDPFASLSPRLTVGEIVGEGLRVHEPGLNAAAREKRILDSLAEVGLDGAVLDRYPHEFSGGQRQRISLARALVLQPDFLVLDEPTSALDVSVQAQILNLLVRLQQTHGLAYLLITHNLAVVDYLADMVAVMYLGRIVETGPAAAVMRTPQHPYTVSLRNAVPDPRVRRPLSRLEGEIPSPLRPPAGCHFHPRCPVYAAAPPGGELRRRCAAESPELREAAGTGWSAACHALPAKK